MKRAILLLLIPILLLPAAVPAQKKKKKADDEGLPPPIILDEKKKKPEVTQTLPLARELPIAVTGQTDSLIFQLSPLSNKGLLSQQVRDSLHALQRLAHGATILKLRAFVAGSGDMRRVNELVAEVWSDRHAPLPAVSVIQTGGLPLEGAQVIIESTAEDHKAVNPNGLVFLSGQPAETLDESLSKLARIVSVPREDMLRVTCFVRSLDENKDALRAIARRFPNAAANYVQTQREYLPPVAECEGVGRSPAMLVGTGNPPPAGSFGILRDPKVVLSATQLAFGTEEGDVKLAFDRLARGLAPFDVRLNSVVMSHIYVMSRGMPEKVRAIRPELLKGRASTIVQVEGLPSLDASLGIDVVATPGGSPTAAAPFLPTMTTDRALLRRPAAALR